MGSFSRGIRFFRSQDVIPSSKPSFSGKTFQEISEKKSEKNSFFLEAFDIVNSKEFSSTRKTIDYDIVITHLQFPNKNIISVKKAIAPNMSPLIPPMAFFDFFPIKSIVKVIKIMPNNIP